MHIQRNRSRYKDKQYTSVLLRQCYYEGGKIKQKTLANLSKLPEYLIRTIELAIKREGIYYELGDLRFEGGINFGDIGVIGDLIKEIGIDEDIYSKTTKERETILMMIIGRILHPSSKLENTRWIKDREEAFSQIYPAVNYKRLKVDDLYEGLDWLERRKGQIEKKLYQKRGEPRLFLYDITSSYLEGEKSEIGEYGYNRDKKRGKKQIVIGLTLDKEGYPIGVEVFKGNTADQKTIKGKVEEMREKYGIEKAILIGDRGMITEARMKDLEREGISFISCLTHKKMEELIKRSEGPIQSGLFDKEIPIEIGYEGRRYILCKSEERCQEERNQLAGLLRKTKGKLAEIKRQVERGRLKDPIKIGERVGKWKNRYNVGKYFITEIGKGKFRYYLNREQLNLGKNLLGCYVVVTNLPPAGYTKQEIIDNYRSLSLVDRAFRIIKTTLLNIRPIYHRKETRIRAHAFICMLSYYVVIEMKKRLKELFQENGKGKNYSLTFENILSQLNKIQIGYIKIKDVYIQQLGEITPLQKKILQLLDVKLKLNKQIIKH